MFPLLYGGSLCIIGGLALVVVAWLARAERRKLWAWHFHDWTLPKAWPGEADETPARWAGLE